MKPFTHLFFDLDGTLWDFERNSTETLRELYHELNLQKLGIPDFEIFISDYHQINDRLWAAYKKHEITKDDLSFSRFNLTLERYGIHDHELALAISRLYVERSPSKTNLLPCACEVLEALRPHYRMHIITNGFSEIQSRKLQASGLDQYFDTLITSDEAGVNKPSPAIFEYALKKTGASASESMMIGDEPEADIEGARGAGMAQIYVNLKNKPSIEPATYEVGSLCETLAILTKN